MNKDENDIEVVDVGADAPMFPSAPSPAETLSFSSTSERLSSESLKRVMENYLSYYAHGEGHTARAKRYDLQYFIEYLARSRRTPDEVMVADWTLQETQNYVDERLSRGEAPSTVARRLATIKHFGRTLAERFPGYINPAREVKSPKFKISRPQGLSEEEIDCLRRAVVPEKGKNGFVPFTAYRDQFLVELLLATGLRADEVRLLVMSQVEEEFEWLNNVKTKGRQFRRVYVNSDIRSLFETYVSLREQELNTRFPMVSSLRGSALGKFPVLVSFYRASLDNPSTFALSPKTIWRVISSAGKKAQALASTRVGNLHPHRLRHTFAHGLLESSRDVRLVAQALGHSDVRTTMRYTERSEEAVAEAIESARSKTSG